MSDFDEIFTKGSIQGEKKFVLRISEKFNFFGNGRYSKFALLVQLWPPPPPTPPRFSLKMAEIGKKWVFAKKDFRRRAIQKSQNQSPLAVPGKIQLLFALFRLFLAGSRPRSKAKGSEAKFEIGYFTTTVPGHLPTKKVLFQHFPVLRL